MVRRRDLPVADVWSIREFSDSVDKFARNRDALVMGSMVGAITGTMSSKTSTSGTAGTGDATTTVGLAKTCLSGDKLWLWWEEVPLGTLAKFSASKC